MRLVECVAQSWWLWQILHQASELPEVQTGIDFGLAKAADESAPADNLTNSPTRTISQTRVGTILGTAAYMSPEQARGKVADRRADVWAFGVVLYEMITGRRMFTGETATEVLASVLKDQPPLDGLPARVRAIVERCLRKDPRQRWQAIGDARVEIENLLADPNGASALEPRSERTPPWKRAIAAVGAVALAAAAGIAAWRFKPVPSAPVSRFSIALREGQAFTNAGRMVVAISTDGTLMAYVANRQLYLRNSRTGWPTAPSNDE